MDKYIFKVSDMDIRTAYIYIALGKRYRLYSWLCLDMCHLGLGRYNQTMSHEIRQGNSLSKIDIFELISNPKWWKQK